MSSMIPIVVMRPKTFYCREYWTLDEETKQWTRNNESSDLTLDEQITEWQDASRPDIRFMSPPGSDVYNLEDGRQFILLTISILYIPSVEESNDNAMGQVGQFAKPQVTASARVTGTTKSAG